MDQFKNPSFNGVNVIYNYRNNVYGVVSNSKVELGDEIDITNNCGAVRIYKKITEIIEQRPSQGEFIEGTIKPTWNKVLVAD